MPGLKLLQMTVDFPAVRGVTRHVMVNVAERPDTIQEINPVLYPNMYTTVDSRDTAGDVCLDCRSRSSGHLVPCDAVTIVTL